MKQNGYEPQNRNIYQAGQPVGYPGQAGGYQQGYPVQGNAGSFGYAPNGYPAGGQGQAPGYPPAAGGYPQGGGMSASQPYNLFPQAQNNSAQAPGSGYPLTGGSPAGSGYYAPYPSGQSAGGYYQPAGGYAPPPSAPVPPAGSFIPQTPYSPGYTSPGYQPPAAGGYQQGYNAYAQMGRNIQNTQPQREPERQVPLNGGGYVPKPVPVRKGPFELKDIALIIAGCVLGILFLIGLILGFSKGNSLPVVFIKILFVVLAAASAAILWIRPMTAENKRLCYTIVVACLAAVTLLSFVFSSSSGRTGFSQATETPTQNVQSNPQQTPGTNVNISGGGSSQPETTAAPSADNAAAQRLAEFLNYWGGNRLEEMLTLCAPSWLSKQENAKTELFSLLRNRTPKDFVLESITGTDADSSRQITLKIRINKNNGKKDIMYRMTVLMLKENGEWYVDPKSFQTNEIEVTADPNITATPAPTPTPYVDANTMLYYNPDGGELYHLDPNCRIINQRYLPLKGHFTFSQINDSPYSGLKPCNVCGAPLR